MIIGPVCWFMRLERTDKRRRRFWGWNYPTDKYDRKNYLRSHIFWQGTNGKESLIR